MPPERLRPQGLVITMLALHARRPEQQIWSGGLVGLLDEFGFSAGAARIALSRLVQRDLLNRVREGRRTWYVVTARCEQLLVEGDRRMLAFGRPEPSRGWTVLWHSIPEAERLARASLARRLRFLGFGPVADGTWISPHDRAAEVQQLLEDLDVAVHAELLVGAPVRLADARSLLARGWDLDLLHARYRSFAERFGRVDPSALADRDAFVTRTLVAHEFRRFPLLDPEAPSEIVDIGERQPALQLFRHLFESLRAGSERYFDLATAGPSIQRAERA
jgi:phenylacetic acid degradation operon negative regulatory protein